MRQQFHHRFTGYDPALTDEAAMPLKARLNDTPVISLDISDADWKKFKERKNEFPFKMMCCDETAILKTSKLGTKFFAHKSLKTCDWEPESVDHLRIKDIIYTCCREEGWHVDPECRFDDCIADIYLENNDRKTVIEVQLSPQNKEETIIRHNKYKEHGLKCIWLFKKNPMIVIDKTIPAFTIVHNYNHFHIHINDRMIELKKFIKMLLHAKIRYKESYSYKKQQYADVYKLNETCWRCNRETPIVTVDSCYELCCSGGYRMHLDEPEIGVELSRLQKSGIKELSDVAPIKERFSKTCGYRYWSNGCIHCGALIGKHFLAEIPELPSKPILRVPFTTGKIWGEGSPHWCIEDDDE